jgi:hypothetical protein
MFFLNLSLPEFLALLSAISGVVVALYLLSRSRRRQKVATLRFWTQAAQPVPSTRRRRIQQPWSLVLQLICLALLLLAIAQLKWGDRERASRDHVLVLDASSWTGARVGGKMVAEEVRSKARQYLRSLPSSDRVMIVRADGLPSPVTGMETDRAVLERAIDETRPGASALDLNAAFAFAAQSRQLNRSTAGEIVFVGVPRTNATGVPVNAPSNLRLLAVDAPVDNVGLTNIGVRRSDANPEAWDILVAVRNYSRLPQRVPLSVTFGGAPAGGTVLSVPAGASENYSFGLRTRAAGWVDARILVKDSLADDNRAILELPAHKTLRVKVFTADPDALRPTLSAHRQIQAEYLSPAAWKSDVDADVVVLDRFNPPSAVKTPSIWIEPPDSSPFKTKARVSGTKQVSWRADNDIAAGIRTRDMRLSDGQVFAIALGDTVLASVDAGPVALLRAKDKSIALGFHPGRSDMKFNLTTPLLFANILRWMQPDVFRGSELHAGSVGTVTLPLDGDADPKQTKVLLDTTELPFTVQHDTLRFYAGAPGIVRVMSGGREQVFSLSLPEVADKSWTPPANVKTGVPGVFERALSQDLWQILAILGALGLAAEWWFYGRRRLMAPTVNGRPSSTAAAASSWRQAS